jgi:hypothetical protein
VCGELAGVRGDVVSAPRARGCTWRVSGYARRGGECAES